VFAIFNQMFIGHKRRRQAETVDFFGFRHLLRKHTGSDEVRAEYDRLRSENKRLRNERNKAQKGYVYYYKKYKQVLEEEKLRTRALFREQEQRYTNLSEEAHELREEADALRAELQRRFNEADQHLNELEPQVVDNVNFNGIRRLKLTDANLKAMCEPVKQHQYVKLVSTSGTKHFYKFVYIETTTGRVVEVEDVLVDVSMARKCIHRGITGKNTAVEVSTADVASFAGHLNDHGFTNAEVQRKWNKSMNFRWSDAYGRKGDLRAKMSRDFLSSHHLYDEPLCPEILAKVQELRGPLIKGNKLPSVCLYCGGEATEDDHYMSRVHRGYINKFLDCAINLVPSCNCHRAGKDTKNSPESPLEWWLDETHAIRQKNKHHPQNKLSGDPQLRESIEKNLRAFHAFFEEFAPALTEEYHASSKEAIEDVLDSTWVKLQSELVKFDVDDSKRFKESTLIKDTNDRFKASSYNIIHICEF